MRVEALDERLNTGALLLFKNGGDVQLRNRAPARRRSQVAPLVLRKLLIYCMRPNTRIFQAVFTADESMVKDTSVKGNRLRKRKLMMQ